MIAPEGHITFQQSPQEWHDDFLKMLPSVRRTAEIAFRLLPDEAREEAVSETIANAFVACDRLIERGRADKIYPSVLARYAVAQIRCGRRVGTKLNTHDAMSPAAQTKHRFLVEQFHVSDNGGGDWAEFVVEDGQTPVPDQAAFRCDFPAWLSTQSPRNRRLAERLAVGDSTNEVAEKFKISPGRVSRLRREFADSWREFHGGLEACEETVSAAVS